MASFSTVQTHMKSTQGLGFSTGRSALAGVFVLFFLHIPPAAPKDLHQSLFGGNVGKVCI